MYISQLHIALVEFTSGRCCRLQLGFQRCLGSRLICFHMFLWLNKVVWNIPIISYIFDMYTWSQGIGKCYRSSSTKNAIYKIQRKKCDWLNQVQVQRPCCVLAILICGVPKTLLLLRSCNLWSHLIITLYCRYICREGTWKKKHNQKITIQYNIQNNDLSCSGYLSYFFSP